MIGALFQGVAVGTLLGLMTGCASDATEHAPSKGPEPVNDAGLIEPCTSCGGEAACTDAVTVLSANHVADAVETDPPPAGGDHHPCWADYGVYGEPLPAQYWVHNLEHGGVVFAYHCPAEQPCDSEISELAELVAERPRAILTSYPHMTSRFAALSWGRRLLTDCLDLEAMSTFYETHADRGPEYITAGAPTGCPTLP